MSAELLYLLDIEGTVAPLSLVTEQLFPYAGTHCAEFLRDHTDDPAVCADLTLLAQENRGETDPYLPCRLPEVRWPALVAEVSFQVNAVSYLLWLMDRNSKSTALKSLQGKIWKVGFESGELKGTLFADVPGALERWAAQGKVAIYSSGSVEAQQLLFRHSNCGDLTPLLCGYFDTRTGPKREPASYRRIVEAMGVEAQQAIFFSDVVAELDAAREAGLATRLVMREGNAPVEDARGHSAIESLALI